MAVERENHQDNTGNLEEEFVGPEEPEDDVFGRADEIFEERYRQVFGQPEDYEEELEEEEPTEVEIPSRRSFLKLAAAVLGWTVVLLEIVNNWEEIKRLVEGNGEKAPEPQPDLISLSEKQTVTLHGVEVTNFSPLVVKLHEEALRSAIVSNRNVELTDPDRWLDGIPDGWGLQLNIYGWRNPDSILLKYHIGYLELGSQEKKIGPWFQSRQFSLPLVENSQTTHQLEEISLHLSVWVENMIGLGPAFLEPTSRWYSYRQYIEGEPLPKSSKGFQPQTYQQLAYGAELQGAFLKENPQERIISLSYYP